MEDTEETKLSGGRRTQSNYYSKSKIESDPKKVLVMSSIILEFEKGIEKSTFPSCLPEGIRSRLRRPESIWTSTVSESKEKTFKSMEFGKYSSLILENNHL